MIAIIKHSGAYYILIHFNQVQNRRCANSLWVVSNDKFVIKVRPHCCQKISGRNKVEFITCNKLGN